jgi:hypothetical protein
VEAAVPGGEEKIFSGEREGRGEMQGVQAAQPRTAPELVWRRGGRPSRWDA